MTITVNVDTASLDRLLSDFQQVAVAAKANALKAIGDEALSQSDRAFKDPVFRPSPWAARKSGGDWPLLVKHPNGGLRASLTSKIIGDDTVVIGTDKKYGVYHQTGTKKMPARPFYPVDAEGELTPRMTRKINKYIQDAFNDELRKLGFH